MTVIYKALTLCGLVALAAACDPSLTLDTGAALVVGQKASIKVTEGGDDVVLLENSLRLTDASKREYTGTNLAATKASADEVQFRVPVGLTAGPASLEVKTQEGWPFSGTIQINRLVVMRDLAGKVWLLAKTGKGTVAQYAEVPQGDGKDNMGKGFGKVAVGPDGTLMASSALSSKTVKVAWLGGTTKVSEQAATFQEQVNDVAVGQKGHILVATSNGLYIMPRPTTVGAALDKGTRLDTGDMRVLAVAGNADRAVALGWVPAGNRYQLRFIEPSSGKVAGTIDLDWKPESGATQSVAMSADGKTTLVVNSKPTKIAVVREGATKAIDAPAPQNEQGPISVSASGSGLFYVLNATSAPSPNVSVVTVDSSNIKFGTPFDPKLTADSGAPIALAASTAGEVIVLAKHDMVLIDTAAKTAKTITFANLFKDKKSGEVGGSVAIQP